MRKSQGSRVGAFDTLRTSDERGAMSDFTERAKDVRVVGIVGLGYVGIPLAMRFADVGLSRPRLRRPARAGRAAKRGRSPIEHIADGAHRRHARQRFRGDGGLRARSPRRTRSSSACRRRSTTIASRTSASSRHDGRDRAVSAAGPDACRSRARPGPARPRRCSAARRGARASRWASDVFLVYSPEREDPGNPTSAPAPSPRSSAAPHPAALRSGMALYEPCHRPGGSGQFAGNAPKWSSCSRTSTARSTSASSTR